MALILPRYLANLKCPCGHTIGDHQPSLESFVITVKCIPGCLCVVNYAGELESTEPGREPRTIPAGAA